MHRFRKKSETRRSDQIPSSPSAEAVDEQEPFPQLPLSNDFRTSLILPDLSRRFTLLRSSSGDPVSFETLRSRLAEQRARGAPNQISEEEEDMILETLRGIRSKNTGPALRSQENVIEGDDSSVRQSVQSTSTLGSLAPSSLSSSPSGRSKRYSNNLFGSGRFRDYTYMRSVTKNGSTRTQSLTPTESSVSLRGNTSSIAESLRPVTPEGSGASSIQSSSNDKQLPRSTSLAAPNSASESGLSAAEYRVSKTLGPLGLKRASLALEEAIKEIEEEAEDEIVMPRSTPIPRVSSDHPPHAPESIRHSDISQSSVFEAGMAISSDKQVLNDTDERRASPVPSRILPGYIPGMPRPMTPRDFDPDDQRSHSTTPRATSPIAAAFIDTSVSTTPNSIPTGLLRRGSTSSQSRPSPLAYSPPASPLFLQRSTNGRYTPDDSNRDNYTEFDNPLNSSLLIRRRPASPLSNAPFQPMAVSSRPGTPSNITWTINANEHQKSSTHGRNDSWASDGGISSSDIHGALEGHTSGPRTLRSPALPDSPTLDAGNPINESNSFTLDNRPASKMSLTELGSPARAPRSVTPTQNPSRSPTSPNFSSNKRSSKQNTPSLFNLGPIPPLIFSPLANSSRSSLESAGSSYHSWDDYKDRYLNLFSDTDPQQPAWHDISASEQSSSATPGGSPDDDWDAEDIISRYAGLKKSDFVAIQEKLVTVASANTNHDRAPSAMRRRRPSTSQSNYSINGREHRVASPPPQAQPPASPVSATTKGDRDLKASALLNSVVDSIKSSRDQPPVLDTSRTSPTSPSGNDMSPTTRRNRDLAQALFGLEDTEQEKNTTAEHISSLNKVDVSPTITDLAAEDSRSPPPSKTPYQLSRNPSTPRIPQTSQEEAELAREVQQKMDAATLALKPPSQANPDPHGGSTSRKRINPNQISNPRLVSASTSVDTVPIPRTPSLSSANNSGPSRIGSRFKKLRGTLRAKSTLPNGDEVTPYPLGINSPPSVQTAHYDPEKLRVPGPPVAASATDSVRFKVPVPSPPASAGPGLKGFMARFRGKQRNTIDTSSDSEHRRSPQLSPPSTFSPSRSDKTFSKPLLTPITRDVVSASPTLRPDTPQTWLPSPIQDSGPGGSEALKQLFDAATNLGLDQAALDDLLARSPSTSSRSNEWTMLRRNNTTLRSGTDYPVDSSRPAPSLGRPSIDQSLHVTTPDSNPTNGRANMDVGQSQNDSVSTQPSERKVPEHVRRPREGQADNRATSTIIRRTIIFPSESKTSPIDLNSLMRKTSNRRKRASATSVSARSVQDRAPTPPPPRSPTSKRFSNGPSPPVPNLPTSVLSQSDNLLNVPSTSAGGPIEKSNSTYDSLYEMYAGESRATSSAANVPITSDTLQTQGDYLPTSETGPALELVEFANGETIWSIVNGLRDDDGESIYTGRASFASEYSTRETTEGGLQIFVKEHVRSSSKSSNASFLSRKKTLTGKQRPETKVFYSSSAQIGRLIENLSQGMEAGTFNFLPNRAPGHSASSSLSTNDLHWTVEERLEHMLGSMRTPEAS
ncbi:hypothetical protein BDZ94DRAFT_1233950 [Collybia nuda]|uniref:Uncharacterized protein n=1 Tax=Collybia nuda TaxID=64659 RepID=A0A9P6CN47_9AGAR|nr:hypothetical protein BDZ94DRAFT_1233950 [Collybia nuda]